MGNHGALGQGRLWLFVLLFGGRLSTEKQGGETEDERHLYDKDFLLWAAICLPWYYVAAVGSGHPLTIHFGCTAEALFADL